MCGDKFPLPLLGRAADQPSALRPWIFLPLCCTSSFPSTSPPSSVPYGRLKKDVHFFSPPFPPSASPSLSLPWSLSVSGLPLPPLLTSQDYATPAAVLKAQGGGGLQKTFSKCCGGGGGVIRTQERRRLTASRSAGALDSRLIPSHTSCAR